MDSSAALIERLVPDAHHMEGIGDLDGVGQHEIERRSVRAGQVYLTPRSSAKHPIAGTFAASSWLHAGVPLGEVARRMRHSVKMLVSTYIVALKGDETAAIDVIVEYRRR